MEQKNNPIMTDNFYLNKQDGFVPVDESKNMRPAVLIDAISFDGQDPDDIRYLLLIRVLEPASPDEDCYEWFIKTGRQTTYDFLKELILSCVVDIDESFIMGETSTIKTSISIYKFMKSVKDNEKIIDNTSFDVDEYRLGNYEGEETGSLLDCIEDHGILFKYRLE